MPKMNLRELRDTRQLKAWLRSGKTVELYERSELLGSIVPPPPKDEPRKWPDFAARTKEIFGDRVLEGSELFIKDRGRY